MSKKKEKFNWKERRNDLYISTSSSIGVFAAFGTEPIDLGTLPPITNKMVFEMATQPLKYHRVESKVAP